jgi:DNA polymerase-3 subunit gamma/tau
MSTLYRKYRPQTFEEVVGQNHIKITLQNELATGKIAHAYLFCGPRAVGKTTSARVLAKSLNCAKRRENEFEPCNTCDACKEITEGRSFDVIEIDAASNTGVDNVRDNIIASARVAPAKNKYKVFIIDEVHMLSISAFNALLKILEEPPTKVVFVLCTTEIHKVPTTIISRCQRFDFKRISVSDIAKELSRIARLDGIKIDKSILETIARQSEGHMRDALSMLGQLVSIGGKEITSEEANLVIPRSDINEIINLIQLLVKKDAGQGIKLMNDLLDSGIDLKSFASDLISILRKIMMSKVSPALGEKYGIELGESLEIKLNEISRDLTIEKLALWMEKFNDARNKIKDCFIMQLPLELAIVELCEERSQANKAISANFAPVNYQNYRTQNTYARPVAAPQANPANNIPANPSYANINLTAEEVKRRWSEVLVGIKKYNHSLSFILRACEPRDLNGNKLCLVFKYKFHKERVVNPQIKMMVENILKEIFNYPLIIESVVDESIEVGNLNISNIESADNNPGANVASQQAAEEGNQDNAENKDKSSIDNLLKNFGGRIVK